MKETRRVIALVKATIAVPVYEGEDVAQALQLLDLTGHAFVTLTGSSRKALIEGDPWAELMKGE